MSRGMNIIDRFTRDRASRFVWGALTLACLGLLLVARVGQDRALSREESAAFGRTERYAATVLPNGIDDGARSPAEGMNTRELYTFIRAEVFTDPTTARVRAYDRDGTIVYDTDLAPAQLVQADNPNVSRAITDGTYGVIVPERFTWSTIGTSGSVVSMLQVYAPVHIPDQVAPDGVFEVDYLVDELRAALERPLARRAAHRRGVAPALPGDVGPVAADAGGRDGDHGRSAASTRPGRGTASYAGAADRDPGADRGAGGAGVDRSETTYRGTALAETAGRGRPPRSRPSTTLASSSSPPS